VIRKPRGVFIHPLALVETSRIGPGTRIWAYAHVMERCRIGRGCNIGEGVFLETSEPVGEFTVIKNGVSVWDRVRLEDRVFVGPAAVFTNDRAPRADPRFKAGPELWEPTRIRTGASIGANATILSGITLGRWCLIGAGAVVTRDVPDHALMLGSPARECGFVCECGRRLPESLGCPCGRRYRRRTSGLSLLPSPRRKSLRPRR
jgi:UDP-2-acetamido-3-amino-2,3-dideoxy-glucuronate N-acetyltransferase